MLFRRKSQAGGGESKVLTCQEPPQQTPTAAGIRDEWKKDILAAHNRFRKDHGVVELQWMDECYLSAKTQANACQEKSAMVHASWPIQLV